MIDQKIAKIAAQAAAAHMGEIISSIHTEKSEEEPTVYAAAFTALMKECDITPEILEERINKWVEQKYASRLTGGVQALISVTNNLLKGSQNSNMSDKVFKKLVEIAFPTE